MTMMIRKTLLLAFTLLLLVPAVSRADEMGKIKLFGAMAQKYWAGGAQPACGTPVISWEMATDIEAETTVKGTVADADPTTCEVHVARDWWAQTRVELGVWSDLSYCRIIFHEYGHLYGHEHTAKGIMEAVQSDDPFPQCDDPIEHAVYAQRNRMLQARRTVALARKASSRYRRTHTHPKEKK